MAWDCPACGLSALILHEQISLCGWGGQRGAWASRSFFQSPGHLRFRGTHRYCPAPVWGFRALARVLRTVALLGFSVQVFVLIQSFKPGPLAPVEWTHPEVHDDLGIAGSPGASPQPALK